MARVVPQCNLPLPAYTMLRQTWHSCSVLFPTEVQAQKKRCGLSSRAKRQGSPGGTPAKSPQSQRVLPPIEEEIQAPVGNDADQSNDEMWKNCAQCLVPPSVADFTNYIRQEFDELRLRLEQLESDISAASTNTSKFCSRLEQQFAEFMVYEEQQRSILAKMVSEALDVEKEARSQAMNEIRSLSHASTTPSLSCSETPAATASSSIAGSSSVQPCTPPSTIVARTASMPLVARPVGTGKSSLDAQPCTPPDTEQHPAAQSDLEILRTERLSGGMLQDLDRAAQQLKDAACGLSAVTACPATTQPSLDPNGGISTTPRVGLGDKRMRTPSPRLGGALIPGVARLNSCPAPTHCPAPCPAANHVWGTLAAHDKSSMVSSGREMPVPSPAMPVPGPAPRHVSTVTIRGQRLQLDMCPPSIRTSLGRPHPPVAEQAARHVGMIGPVEGVASDGSSRRRMEACPPHLASSKSTSSPDLQLYPHVCMGPRAASPMQRASPRV